MFNRARLKLTVYYLLIIMLISILFSIAIYKVMTREYERITERQQELQDRSNIGVFQTPDGVTIFRRTLPIDPAVLDESRQRIEIILLIINLIILGLSGVAGYFLAGKTLRPIEQMLDEQNRFITDSSHELRTPLTALRSEIEVNLRDKNLSLVGARKLLESNLEEVNNLQSLSDNLIKLTQYQKGVNRFSAEGAFDFEDISLREVSDEAVRKVSSLAKNKNIKIENNSKDIKIQANRQTLPDLLVIFLDNSIKYSPKGKKVTLNSKRIDHSVVITIKDQGIGIDKEDIPHIFDRFYRVDKSRTKVETSGYGLGLSIAEEIVQKHGGSIKVESEVGKGTTFNIQLPLRH